MPQARSGGSGGRGGSRSSSGGGARSSRSSGSGSTGSRSTGARSGRAAASTKKATTRKATTKKATAGKRASSSSARSTRAKAGTTEARVEAAAQRLRKLNERIIEAGKEAGETTLTSYEKALKTIASTLERGPGSSDIEWLSNLATAQAKFIRDLTSSWTAAARKMLK
jgi:hypothetical protein